MKRYLIRALDDEGTLCEQVVKAASPAAAETIFLSDMQGWEIIETIKMED